MGATVKCANFNSSPCSNCQVLHFFQPAPLETIVDKENIRNMLHI